MIVPLVVNLSHSHIEHALGFLNVFGDFWQVRDLQGSAVLLDNFHHRNVMPEQLRVFGREFLLRPLKGLLDKVLVLGAHRRGVLKGAKGNPT